MDNNKYIEKITKIFDTHEKWAAFLELVKVKNEITTSWYALLQNSVKHKINNEVTSINPWKLRSWRPNSYGYYLEHFGEGSIILLFEDNNFCIYTESINKLQGSIDRFLNTKLFRSYFENNEINTNSKYLAKKSNVISINGQNDVDIISWYAKNQEESDSIITNEVFKLFERFISDQEIVKTIEELNIIIQNQ